MRLHASRLRGPQGGAGEAPAPDRGAGARDRAHGRGRPLLHRHPDAARCGLHSARARRTGDPRRPRAALRRRRARLRRQARCHGEDGRAPRRSPPVREDALMFVLHGIENAGRMAYEVWWALAFGFAVSAVVQAWVPRAKIERALSGSGLLPVARATALGAASSSCSYAAVAIAKSLFSRGASAASALAFQFASTNLVWELGLVLWVLLGWQFTLGEYLGGLVMIALMAILLRRFVSPRLEQAARAHAERAQAGHQHHSAGQTLRWRQRLTTASAWSDVAHNFRGDWQMLYREIGLGLLLAGFLAQVPGSVFSSLFLSGSPQIVQTLWGAFIGPVIAVLTFVCSVGNVPLAAVLWSRGISFAGVMAFIFADLVILPLLVIYRKYYGTRFALRITGLMFVTMGLAALAIDGLFSAAGVIPGGDRPTAAAVFGSVSVNYTLVLDLLGIALFAGLIALTRLHGATDPVCRMKVGRVNAPRQ